MKIITNREDFVKNDAHKSLFIEAGAGAGKSTTMVDKIVQNILSGVLPEKIVAITFTNKSAEDLLIRVSERINNETIPTHQNNRLKFASVNFTHIADDIMEITFGSEQCLVNIPTVSPTVKQFRIPIQDIECAIGINNPCNYNKDLSHFELLPF